MTNPLTKGYFFSDGSDVTNSSHTKTQLSLFLGFLPALLGFWPDVRIDDF